MIPPALTPEQWAQKHLTVQAERYGEPDMPSEHCAAAEINSGPGYLYLTEHECNRWAVLDTPQIQCAMIALANAALPDDDPRKITHSQVGVLLGIIAVRDELDRQGMGGHTYNLTIPNTLLDIIATLAGALESHLPPSTPITP